MLCEICHRYEAERKLNKVINGSYKTLYVCKDCFNRSGEGAVIPQKKCPNCGRTLEEINQTFLVGCAKCYETFSSELQEVIRKVQQL